MAGGSKSTSTSQQQSTSGSAQQWANPYAIQGVNAVYDTYKANQPNLDQQVQQANALSGKLSGNYDNLAGKADTASQLGSKASGYYGDVLGGKYLEGNPYLDAIMGQIGADVTNATNSQFTAAGRYGSGAHTGVLAKELANADSMLRYGDYNNQMNRMDTAAAGSLAQQNAATQLQSQAAQLAMAQQGQAAQLPYTGSAALAQALSALFGGGSSSGTSSGTTTTSPDLLSPLIGAGGAVGAAFASDPVVKRDAILIAREPDGLGLWEYSYLGSDEREFGVMADEVASIRPWALGPTINGIRTVIYEVL